ncbi:MAG: fasciclin domain-containing protein [Clostridium sp.]|nr:fasciclin domain-containing protein [Clostridium sp.]
MALGVGCTAVLAGCSDDYDLAKTEPSSDILGSSIYDFLKNDGGFTTFLRLVDDLDYAETLQRTGSKTIFPARDEAFERFFRDNPFGVGSYEELSISQKKILLNQATINMAYLSEMLPNIGGSTGPTKDVAIRRSTQSVYYDTIAVVSDPLLFANENGQWARFASKGSIVMVEEAPMIVQFTPEVMQARNISASDFSLLHNGATSAGDDIYINGIRVVERDKICKNGYIHILEDVLTPLRTMADAIASDPGSSTFSRLMDRFCAPYYDQAATEEIKRNFTGSDPKYPALQVDSVFRKGYFNLLTHTTTPDGERLGENVLRFDPAQVSYSNSDIQTDMGVMFVPTDKAMREYYDSPEGKFLKTNYPTWDDVPVSLLAKFIQNHQKNSFLTSLPHDWDSMNDEKSFPMNIKPADVDHTEICSNGIVYFLNKVVAPVDFRATYAPTLVTDNTQIMKWALLDGEDLSDANGMRFFMYLYSMENMYNLVVPTDEAMTDYRDPVSWGNSANLSGREIWEFFYNPERLMVNAHVYGVDENGDKDVNALKRTITDVDIIRSRFKDILDIHTVVGTMEDGVMGGYLNEGNPGNIVLTKGGAALNLNGLGNSLKIAGMGDLENGRQWASVTKDNRVFQIFDNDNGRTYFVDHLLHDSQKTVYDILGENPEFRAFRELCTVPPEILNTILDEDNITPVFEIKTGTTLSSGTVVSFFNNYRYTVFVPTEQAINDAIAADPELFTWDQIIATPSDSERKERTRALLKFIRYHFVDNSMYINGLTSPSQEYYTSARTAFDTFHSVHISRTPTSLIVTDENGNSSTITAGNESNLAAREVLYHNKGVEKYIDASSRAVIHKIDRALTFKK